MCSWYPICQCFVSAQLIYSLCLVYPQTNPFMADLNHKQHIPCTLNRIVICSLFTIKKKLRKKCLLPPGNLQTNLLWDKSYILCSSLVIKKEHSIEIISVEFLKLFLLFLSYGKYCHNWRYTGNNQLTHWSQPFSLTALLPLRAAIPTLSAEDTVMQ